VSKSEKAAQQTVEAALAALPDVPLDGSTIRVDSLIAHRQPAQTDDPVCHFLVVLDGADAGVWHEMGAQPLLIGRTPPAEIVLAHAQVSRRHCRVRVEGVELIVQDEGSTNGTHVDDVRVVAPQPIPLGGVLRIGPVRMRHLLSARSNATEALRLLEQAQVLQDAALDVRVQIDDTRRREEVQRITHSDYFQSLLREVEHLRSS